MAVSATAFAQRAVELALLNPPIPYVYGGRKRTGTDCSNLIRLIIRELGGKDIEAGSNTMWNKHVIDRHHVDDGGTKQYGGDLQPGDLLFIDDSDPPSKSANGTPGAMGHIGIYVGPTGLKTHDGLDATVVHASSSQKTVCFSSIPKNFIRWTHSARLKVLDYDDAGIPITEDSTPASTEETAPVTTQTAPGPGQAMINTNDTGLLLRSAPKKVKGNEIKEMPKGTIVQVLLQFGEWTQVHFVNYDGVPHEGWCKSSYLLFGS